jgi:hypothetical protein
MVVGMKRDDIILMAKEACFTDGELAWHDHMLERFAALVSDAEAKRMHDEGMVTVGHMREQIAAEREACAMVCTIDIGGMGDGYDCAAAIRARGQQ